MTRYTYPQITVDTKNPDPTNAIDAFLCCMAKARELGMVPPTAHVLAEHLFRNDARLVFYSSLGGINALVMDEEAMDGLEDDEMFDFTMSILKRVARRRKQKAAQGIEAAAAGETGTGSTEGESPVVEDHAPETHEDGEP